jgi:hypothetical protein
MKNENITNSLEYIEAQKEIANLRWLLNNRNNESIDFIIMRTIEAEDKVKDLEKALNEQNSDEKIEALKEKHRKEVEELNNKVKKEQNNYRWLMWRVGEMDASYREKDKRVEDTKKEIEENKILIEDLRTEMELLNEGSESHLDALELAKKWNDFQKGLLRDELAKKEKNIHNEKTLRQEAESEKKQLKWELHLNTKPLPKIPSKFKLLRKKIATKFQKLMERNKKQELVARIEVKNK